MARHVDVGERGASQAIGEAALAADWITAWMPSSYWLPRTFVVGFCMARIQLRVSGLKAFPAVDGR